jgi:3-methyladenine DNA glycosylase AlkD
MDQLLSELRSKLNEVANPDNQAGAQRYFKEAIRSYGIKMGEVRAIARAYAPAGKDKAQVFALCEELWRSGIMEEGHIAAIWAYALRRQFAEDDLTIFETWVDHYVSNWALCDNFCNAVMGAYFNKFPSKLNVLLRWARSPNRWMRRAAAVSLIVPGRKGTFLSESFAIAETLLRDEDDLVLKGYGWLLKEQCKEHEAAVLEFVLQHKSVMPRTALRYAIENMPEAARREAMKR